MRGVSLKLSQHAAEHTRQQYCRRWFQSIPVIDIAPLVQGDQVKNHGVPVQACQKLLKEAHSWFELPEEVKQQIRIKADTHYRGYQRLGANVTRYEEGYQRDWHEAIDFYREQSPHTTPRSPIHGSNQWPTQLPSFDAALREYINNMLQLGSHLMRGIAVGLGLNPRYFDGQRAGPSESYWCTRVIHYPPLAQGTSHQKREGGIREAAARGLEGKEVARSVQLSCGEHTDYGLLTLVNQDADITALQVKNKEGQWINADPIPGTFVCNIGDMLKVWSNGLYQPTPHRVINADPSRSRVSIPFFYEPCYEALIQPPEDLVHRSGTESIQPKPVRYGDHLEGKVLSNFEL